MAKEQDGETVTKIAELIRIDLGRRTPKGQTRRFHWDTFYTEWLDQNVNLGYENIPRIKDGVLQRLVDNQIMRKDGDDILFLPLCALPFLYVWGKLRFVFLVFNALTID